MTMTCPMRITSAWVSVPDSSSLDLSGAMTLEAWVDPASLGSVWRCVVFKEQTGSFDYSLYAHDGANMLAHALQPHGGIVIWRAFVYSPGGDDRAVHGPFTAWRPERQRQADPPPAATEGRTNDDCRRFGPP